MPRKPSASTGHKVAAKEASTPCAAEASGRDAMERTVNWQQQMIKRTAEPPPASKGVIIQVLEEQPLRPSRRRCHTTKNTSSTAWPSRPPSLGYDRKQLLLAYTQHLRRIHAQRNQALGWMRSNSTRPSWGNWKAAFLCTQCSMKSKPFRWKTPLWYPGILRRVIWRRRRRRRVEYYSRIESAAEDSKACSCPAPGVWRRILRRISWVWRCGNGYRGSSGYCRGRSS